MCINDMVHTVYTHTHTHMQLLNGDLVSTGQPSYNIDGYLVINGEANVKLLSMSANKCGPCGTLGAHTITLGMVQPYLQGTRPRFVAPD